MKKRRILAVLFILLLFLLLHYPKNQSGIFHILLNIPGIVVGFILAVVIHELGHLVFGLISGYKFTSFRVLFFKIYKKDRIKIGFELVSFFIPGQCLMKPTNDKYFIYNLGGLIFTYIFSIILLCLFYNSNNIYLTEFIFGMFVVNTLLAIINSIYNKNGVNDICNIIKCRNNDFKEGLLFQLDIISNIYQKDKLKSKYNPKDDVCDLVANISIWRLKYFKAYNEKKHEQMEHYYDLLKNSYNKINLVLLKVPILTLLLNHEFIIKKDVNLVRRRINRIKKSDYVYINKYKKEMKLVNFYKDNVLGKKDCDDLFFEMFLTKNTDIFEKLNNNMYETLKRIFKAYVKNDYILKVK